MSKTKLNKFLASGVLKGNFIVLNVVKKIDTGKYIVGDSSGLGVLLLDEEGKELKSDSTIKIVKPMKVDDTTLKCSPKLSPIKTSEKVELTPTKAEIKEIESKYKFTTQDVNIGKQYITFESIKLMPPGSFIQSVTFLVTNMSRTIQTQSGQYQICGLKDIGSEKISINMYDKHINKLEVGDVFTATKLKKFLIKKNEKYETRLQTTKHTIIHGATENDKSSFKSVNVADESVDGTILGFTNLLCYYSCAQHWNKVNDDKVCQVCGGVASETKFDFKIDMLIECNNEEQDVKTFMMFKRTAKMITSEETEEAVESKLEEFEGRKCTVEHNDPGDSDQTVIIKNLIIHV